MVVTFPLGAPQEEDLTEKPIEIPNALCDKRIRKNAGNKQKILFVMEQSDYKSTGINPPDMLASEDIFFTYTRITVKSQTVYLKL